MKKVFLTGSSSGIGAEFKQHLLASGFDITAPLRSELDLSAFDIDSVNLSSYDYLILCAGIDTNGRQPFVNLSTADFVNTVNVNLIANMKLIHQYVKQRQGWGKIIVLGSTIVDKVYPNFVAYGTSKVALDVFVDSLAQELRKTEIGLCTIHPGLVKTDFHYNRGNVPEQDRNILYDTLPHLITSELIPTLDQIVDDRQHAIKKVVVSR